MSKVKTNDSYSNLKLINIQRDGLKKADKSVMISNHSNSESKKKVKK